MAPPLYFFARRQLGDVVRDGKLLPSLLHECKLDATFGDIAAAGQCAVNEITTHGPGDASGVLLTAIPASGEVPKRIGYQPDFQTWRQATKTPGGQDLWTGIDREHPPTPEDLLRANAARSTAGELLPPHQGYWVTLADGNRWCVPVVRRPAIVAKHGDRPSEFPTDVGWDLEGRFVETLKPQFQPLFDEAAGLVGLFYDDEGRPRDGNFEISVEAGLSWCLKLLGLNYRVGPHEQNLLRVIDQSNVWLVLGLAIDTPLMQQLVGAPAD